MKAMRLSFFRSPKKMLDVAVLVLAWFVSVWRIVTRMISFHGPNHYLIDRAAKSLTVVLMLCNILLALSSYTIIGATITLIYQVVKDFTPTFCIMLLFAVAYTYAMRIILRPREDFSVADDADFAEKYAILNISPFEESDFVFLDGFQVAFTFGFLGELDGDAIISHLVDGTEKDVINNFATITFYLYAMISNVILLNLLIAIMSDSYDRVKGHEAVARRLQRAKTLCDIDQIWGPHFVKQSYFNKYYPNSLHILTQKDSFGQKDTVGETVWEGKMRSTMDALNSSMKKIMVDQNTKLANRLEDRLEQLDKKMIDRLGELELRLNSLESTKRPKTQAGHLLDTSATLLARTRMLNRLKPTGRIEAESPSTRWGKLRVAQKL